MPNPNNCESKPFIKLQESNSNAPILNYNMEQENCVNLFSTLPFKIPILYFKEDFAGGPSTTPQAYALRFEAREVIKDKIINDLKQANSVYFLNYKLVVNCPNSVVFFMIHL
ncbi:MAG: hypothetical protein IPK03_00430 [Bacteroidetes bacterium]|nr:hypothetical protein [Bacteroidota bacterium]